MPNQINSHVSRLFEYLPLDAGSSTLFQEYVDPNEHQSIPTRALEFLRHAVGLPDGTTRLIVLTGDAGHGKTHLCAQLLESYGYDPVEAGAALTSRCDGSQDLAELPSGKSLRIVKDLSELPVEQGASALVNAIGLDDAVTIVCANEGRLRSALLLEREALDPVRLCLEDGLSSGRLDTSEIAVVLNLNFQSVVASESPMARGLLRNWAVDARRWKICSQCDAQPSCPIYENHRLLADRSLGPRRLDGVEVLLQTAERIGAVITVRELLMMTAYTITGGLRCADVHVRAGRRDWQHDFEFSQNLFGDRLTPSERQALRSLRFLQLLDPGAVAIRTVDDSLSPEQTDAEGRFLPRQAVIDDVAVTTRAQAKSAAAAMRGLFRFLRRRDFFLARDTSSSLQRLGFTFGDQFMAIVGGGLDPATFRKLRDQLIAGIEAVQGLRRSGESRNLLLVDPAFGSGTTGTSIVARHVPITSVQIQSQSSAWAAALGRPVDLPNALDWSDRVIVIELLDGDQVHPLKVDLLTFEYLMRAGEGLDGRIFFDAEVRRLAGALGSLVGASQADDQIEIVREGRLEGLVIDTGNVVRKVVD